MGIKTGTKGTWHQRYLVQASGSHSQARGHSSFQTTPPSMSTDMHK